VKKGYSGTVTFTPTWDSRSNSSRR